MTEKLVEYLKNKKIAILGLGREGKSTYTFLRSHFPHKSITICDQNEEIKKREDDGNDNIIWKLGADYLTGLEEYDLVIKTPGISLKNENIEKWKDKITSQLELLLRFIPIFTIGVTGTKGKSTTSSLVYEVLKQQGKEPILIGNIGKPAFDEIEKMKQGQMVVIEMSSHQLEYMDISPNIAILLNIFEEHLDHYRSFVDYAKAKYHIGEYQTEKDAFLYNADNEEIRKLYQEKPLKSECYAISRLEKKKEKHTVYKKEGKIYFDTKEIYEENMPRHLVGEHNLQDIMFVLAVSEILKLDLKKTQETIQNFMPLPHRMEYVGKYDGVFYYNDSIATIPQATIEAVTALKEVSTLIIGGMDRKIDYTSLIQFLNQSTLDFLVCLPDTGWEIAEKVQNETMQVVKVKNLEEAVKVAKEKTKKEKICLLSPAAASYGFFKNFEERGDYYKTLVKA